MSRREPVFCSHLSSHHQVPLSLWFLFICLSFLLSLALSLSTVYLSCHLFGHPTYWWAERIIVFCSNLSSHHQVPFSLLFIFICPSFLLSLSPFQLSIYSFNSLTTPPYWWAERITVFCSRLSSHHQNPASLRFATRKSAIQISLSRLIINAATTVDSDRVEVRLSW